MSDFTLDSYRATGRPSRRPTPGSALRAAIATGLRFVDAMFRARSTRRMLMDMDDRLLADIGIGRGDAMVEAHRAMWDVSPRRR